MEKQITPSITFYNDDMALRDQPYMPLYVQDFLTDEKLNECSASATGVYIKIMCLMHKSEVYGAMWLKQKDKQNENQIVNFALKFAKLLPFSYDVLFTSLTELLEEKVLFIEGDSIAQKRMMADGELSLIRSETGRKGGIKTQENINFAKANRKPNTEYESDTENDLVFKDLNVSFEDFWDLYDKKVGEKGKLTKKWENLKPADRTAAMEHIPRYKLAEPNKKYRKNPDTYLNNKSWNDEIIHSNGTTGTNQKQSGKNGKSAGAEELTQRLADKLAQRGSASTGA